MINRLWDCISQDCYFAWALYQNIIFNPDANSMKFFRIGWIGRHIETWLNCQYHADIQSYVLRGLWAIMEIETQIMADAVWVELVDCTLGIAKSELFKLLSHQLGR